MVTHRRMVEEEGADFYPTPPWGTAALLKYVKFDGEILEPCCGTGEMAEVLKAAGYPVIHSDLHDRGYGAVANFFDIDTKFANIVTNPPFNIAEEVFEHAFKLARRKVCLLLRTAFLESRRRYETIYRTRRPSLLLVFTERLSMYPKGLEQNGGGTTSYSWFVWDVENPAKTTQVEWIEPGMKPGSKSVGGLLRLMETAE